MDYLLFQRVIKKVDVLLRTHLTVKFVGKWKGFRSSFCNTHYSVTNLRLVTNPHLVTPHKLSWWRQSLYMCSVKYKSYLQFCLLCIYFKFTIRLPCFYCDFDKVGRVSCRNLNAIENGHDVNAGILHNSNGNFPQYRDHLTGNIRSVQWTFRAKLPKQSLEGN